MIMVVFHARWPGWKEQRLMRFKMTAPSLFQASPKRGFKPSWAFDVVCQTDSTDRLDSLTDSLTESVK